MKTSVILFIVGVVLIVLGALAIIEANSRQRESGLNYKTERIIAIVGIVLSALNWIIGIILHMS